MDRKGMEKLIERLKKEDCEVRCVYEAGPCGYELYRKLRKAGIHCDVIVAPIGSADFYYVKEWPTQKGHPGQ